MKDGFERESAQDERFEKDRRRAFESSSVRIREMGRQGTSPTRGPDYFSC
jgi:hypothetical protein